MIRAKPGDLKRKILTAHGTLNPRPKEVTDMLFLTDPFFDPRDLVQVKYEMLRRVQTEGQPVTETTTAFGFSRPSFYQALSAYQQMGLAGLLPQKRGPKQAHKLTSEVIQFLREHQAADSALRPSDLVTLIHRHFGIVVHARSIERALARSQKKQIVR